VNWQRIGRDQVVVFDLILAVVEQVGQAECGRRYGNDGRHLGHTWRFWSRSFFQMIWRHWSHLTQRPSVLTRFSPEVSSSPCSRLNHAMEVVSQCSRRNEVLSRCRMERTGDSSLGGGERISPRRISPLRIGRSAHRGTGAAQAFPPHGR